LTHLLPFIGYPRTLNALRAVEEATASRAAERCEPGQQGR
jgi:hypothetical protein